MIVLQANAASNSTYQLVLKINFKGIIDLVEMKAVLCTKMT